jgi:hypothetical protein
LLFSYDSNPSDTTKYKVDLTGNAKIFGAITTNHGGDNLNGTFDAVYDQQVICNLRHCNGHTGGSAVSPFVRLMIVPGSWKDW